MRLSVDYRKYDHFVRFGSAEERLKNFRYKLSQIEYYDEKIADLSYNALATASNSDVTGSYYHTKNVDNFKPLHFRSGTFYNKVYEIKYLQYHYMYFFHFYILSFSCM